jgi:hypothetical protein
MPAPFSETGDRVIHQLKTSLFEEGEMSLPKTATFVDPGFLVVGRRKVARSAPFDKGFKAGIYSAEGYIQVGPLKVPKEFTLQVFRPQPGAARPEELELEQTYTAFITNSVLTARETSLIPSLHGVDTSIVDTRFGSQAYVYRSPAWRSASEILKSVEFRGWIKNHNTPLPPLEDARTKAAPGRRWAVLSALFLFVLVGPAIALLAMARRRGNSITQDQ